MATISLLLQNVHGIVHVFDLKMNYSEPKIYTGGIDITKWSKLSKAQQKKALEKDWYVYYSFRNPETGKLKRQPNIKAGANKLKTRKERLAFLKTMQRNLTLLLEAGFNPYKDNSTLKKAFLSTHEKETTPVPVAKENVIQQQQQNKNSVAQADQPSIQEAFALGLKTKARILNTNSFSKYKSRVGRFEKWLLENGFKDKPIGAVTKKVVVQYLNEVLQQSSPRNRNNSRSVLSSLFQTLENNEIIPDNFIRKINILKAVPKRNKTYTPSLQHDIYNYLKENDPILLLFVQFVSYNFLRPIEVCRLRIEDVDIADRKIYVRAKNSPVKIKIIPEILIKELPDLSTLDKKDFLFTSDKIGGAWDTTETNKRDYFSKRFRKVKDHFGLGKDYGLYSFRHTFITKLYRELAKNATPFETKSKLMLITGHTTITALEKYLRDIDAELLEDYSEFLK